VHKEQLPFLEGPQRLAVRAVNGGVVGVYRSAAQTVDRRSGRSRRRLRAGRADSV